MKPHVICELSKEVYQDYELVFAYETMHYYEAVKRQDGCQWLVTFTKKSFDLPVKKEFISNLYPPHWMDASVFGIFEDKHLIAVLEVEREHWSKRLRVCELWVHEDFRRRGCGQALMNHAKGLVKIEGFRAIILETQSCNAPAISFYLAQKFDLAGFDCCCYSNDDVANNEVRLEFAWLLQ